MGADGRCDGVVEEREEFGELDGSEALRGEELERGEVLAHVASRGDHAEVEGARGQAARGALAGEGVLESGGGGVVALAAVADDSGAGGEQEKEGEGKRGEEGVQVAGAVNFWTDGLLVVGEGHFVDYGVLCLLAEALSGGVWSLEPWGRWAGTLTFKTMAEWMTPRMGGISLAQSFRTWSNWSASLTSQA